ncbi:MAG: outer membrane beta-barrel domain-containing protein [Pseudobdellovibrionaceae bacterium]
MKNLNLIFISYLFASALATSTAFGAQINAKEDIDTLGGNKELMEMADKVKSTSRSRIVQERIVDRHHAIELGLSYGNTFGGDAYLKTQSLGVAVDYHFTPRWSLGVRYYDFGNSLTSEGQRIFNEARAAYAVGGRAHIVDIDYPLNATMAVLNWYPIYGKTSFLDMGITQFDIYVLAGGGTINLSSGNTSVLTTGLGLGAWITKHLTSRMEIRYQKYEDQIITGSRSVDSVVGSIGLGWIL